MITYEERRKFVIDVAFESIKNNWPDKKQTWLAQRYALMSATGLLSSCDEEKIEFALKMIEECGELPDCSFCPMLSVEILHKHSNILNETVKEKLIKYLKDGAFEKMLLPSFDYIGVNDNFPSMASYAAIIGGEYFNDKRAIEIGKNRLMVFYKMLMRRDMASEFTSPCYLPTTMSAIIPLVNDVQDEEIKNIALKCEEKLWLDIASHYYPELNIMAGPYSRAYKPETLAMSSNDKVLYYMAWGYGDPMEFASNDSIHDNRENESNCCWVAAAGGVHCPEELKEIAINKKYPFETSLTAEISTSRYMDNDDIKSLRWEDYRETALNKDRLDEYPSGVTVNTTYMNKDFAMGTALRAFHSGIQTDSLHVIYRKNDKNCTFFTKYSVNDKFIGQDNYNEWLKCNAMPCLDDEGRKFGIQAGSTSLMVYKPTYWSHDNLSQARLQIIFNSQGLGLDRVCVDGKDVKENETFDEIKPFFIEDASVYAAFIPLEVSDLGRKYAMKYSNINGFGVFALYNYIGETKVFRKNEMLLASNGFVVIVKSKNEFSSFEDFMNKYKDYELKDEMFASGHSRGAHERKIYFKNCETEFDFVYSPMTEGIRCAVANGKVIV